AWSGGHVPQYVLSHAANGGTPPATPWLRPTMTFPADLLGRCQGRAIRRVGRLPVEPRCALRVLDVAGLIVPACDGPARTRLHQAVSPARAARRTGPAPRSPARPTAGWQRIRAP